MKLFGVTVDAKPQIQRGANQQAVRIQRELDAKLPSFLQPAKSLWRLLHTTIALDATTRLLVRPTGVIQGKVTREHGEMRFPVGVVGQVAIVRGPSVSRTVAPLTAPRFRPALTPGVSLHIPVDVSYEMVAASLTRRVQSSVERRVGVHRLRALAFRAMADQRGVVLVMTFAGDWCGQIALLTEPFFDQRQQAIGFRYIRPLDGEVFRIRRVDSSFDWNAAASLLPSEAVVPLPVDVHDLSDGVTEAVGLFGKLDEVDARVRSVRSRASAVWWGPHAVSVQVDVTGEVTVP